MPNSKVWSCYDLVSQFAELLVVVNTIIQEFSDWFIIQFGFILLVDENVLTWV